MNSIRTGLVPITAALADGGTPTTSVPGYDRSQVTAGIAHIGVGNFHRVHQGVYLDDLLAARTDHNEWGIVGVGLRDQDTSKAKAHDYEQQNCLYTVTLSANDGRQTSRIVSSMVD